MPLISDIAAALEGWAPKATQQSYDNVGLQVGDAATEVTRCVVALDLTPAVVEEAISCDAELIITHHPLIFRPLKSVTTAGWHGSLVLRLVQAGISLYCIHTNLDAAADGVSFALAERLGLQEVQFLRPLEDIGINPEEQLSMEIGMGAVGILEQPESLQDFLHRTAEALNTNGIRYVGNVDMPVRRIAVCGGSGSDLIPDAMRAGVDVYLTADITYHRFFDVLDVQGRPRMALVDVMHYETEVCTETLLAEWLKERFLNVEWLPTETRSSPIHTFISLPEGGV